MPYLIIRRPSGRYFLKNKITGDVLVVGYDTLAEAKIARARLRRARRKRGSLFGSGL